MASGREAALPPTPSRSDDSSARTSSLAPQLGLNSAQHSPTKQSDLLHQKILNILTSATGTPGAPGSIGTASSGLSTPVGPVGASASSRAVQGLESEILGALPRGGSFPHSPSPNTLSGSSDGAASSPIGSQHLQMMTRPRPIAETQRYSRYGEPTVHRRALSSITPSFSLGSTPSPHAPLPPASAGRHSIVHEPLSAKSGRLLDTSLPQQELPSSTDGSYSRPVMPTGVARGQLKPRHVSSHSLMGASPFVPTSSSGPLPGFVHGSTASLHSHSSLFDSSRQVFTRRLAQKVFPDDPAQSSSSTATSSLSVSTSFQPSASQYRYHATSRPRPEDDDAWVSSVPILDAAAQSLAGDTQIRTPGQYPEIYSAQGLNLSYQWASLDQRRVPQGRHHGRFDRSRFSTEMQFALPPAKTAPSPANSVPSSPLAMRDENILAQGSVIRLRPHLTLPSPSPYPSAQSTPASGMISITSFSPRTDPMNYSYPTSPVPNYDWQLIRDMLGLNPAASKQEKEIASILNLFWLSLPKVGSDVVTMLPAEVSTHSSPQAGAQGAPWPEEISALNDAAGYVQWEVYEAFYLRLCKALLPPSKLNIPQIRREIRSHRLDTLVALRAPEAKRLLSMDYVAFMESLQETLQAWTPTIGKHSFLEFLVTLFCRTLKPIYQNDEDNELNETGAKASLLHDERKLVEEEEDDEEEEEEGEESIKDGVDPTMGEAAKHDGETKPDEITEALPKVHRADLPDPAGETGDDLDSRGGGANLFLHRRRKGSLATSDLSIGGGTKDKRSGASDESDKQSHPSDGSARRNSVVFNLKVEADDEEALRAAIDNVQEEALLLNVDVKAAIEALGLANRQDGQTTRQELPWYRRGRYALPGKVAWRTHITKRPTRFIWRALDDISYNEQVPPACIFFLLNHAKHATKVLQDQFSSLQSLLHWHMIRYLREGTHAKPVQPPPTRPPSSQSGVLQRPQLSGSSGRTEQTSPPIEGGQLYTVSQPSDTVQNRTNETGASPGEFGSLLSTASTGQRHESESETQSVAGTSVTTPAVAVGSEVSPRSERTEAVSAVPGPSTLSDNTTESQDIRSGTGALTSEDFEDTVSTAPRPSIHDLIELESDSSSGTDSLDEADDTARGYSTPAAPPSIYERRPDESIEAFQLRLHDLAERKRLRQRRRARKRVRALLAKLSDEKAVQQLLAVTGPNPAVTPDEIVLLRMKLAIPLGVRGANPLPRLRSMLERAVADFDASEEGKRLVDDESRDIALLRHFVRVVQDASLASVLAQVKQPMIKKLDTPEESMYKTREVLSKYESIGSSTPGHGDESPRERYFQSQYDIPQRGVDSTCGEETPQESVAETTQQETLNVPSQELSVQKDALENAVLGEIARRRILSAARKRSNITRADIISRMHAGWLRESLTRLLQGEQLNLTAISRRKKKVIDRHRQIEQEIRRDREPELLELPSEESNQAATAAQCEVHPMQLGDKDVSSLSEQIGLATEPQDEQRDSENSRLDLVAQRSETPILHPKAVRLDSLLEAADKFKLDPELKEAISLARASVASSPNHSPPHLLAFEDDLAEHAKPLSVSTHLQDELAKLIMEKQKQAILSHSFVASESGKRFITQDESRSKEEGRSLVKDEPLLHPAVQATANALSKQESIIALPSALDRFSARTVPADPCSGRLLIPSLSLKKVNALTSLQGHTANERAARQLETPMTLSTTKLATRVGNFYETTAYKPQEPIIPPSFIIQSPDGESILVESGTSAAPEGVPHGGRVHKVVWSDITNSGCRLLSQPNTYSPASVLTARPQPMVVDETSGDIKQVVRGPIADSSLRLDPTFLNNVLTCSGVTNPHPHRQTGISGDLQLIGVRCDSTGEEVRQAVLREPEPSEPRMASVPERRAKHNVLSPPRAFVAIDREALRAQVDSVPPPTNVLAVEYYRIDDDASAATSGSARSQTCRSHQSSTAATMRPYMPKLSQAGAMILERCLVDSRELSTCVNERAVEVYRSIQTDNLLNRHEKLSLMPQGRKLECIATLHSLISTTKAERDSQAQQSAREQRRAKDKPQGDAQLESRIWEDVARESRASAMQELMVAHTQSIVSSALRLQDLDTIRRIDQEFLYTDPLVHNISVAKGRSLDPRNGANGASVQANVADSLVAEDALTIPSVNNTGNTPVNNHIPTERNPLLHMSVAATLLKRRVDESLTKLGGLESHTEHEQVPASSGSEPPNGLSEDPQTRQWEVIGVANLTCEYDEDEEIEDPPLSPHRLKLLLKAQTATLTQQDLQ